MYTNTNEYCFNSSCNRKVVLYQDLLYQVKYNILIYYIFKLTIKKYNNTKQS